MSFPDILGDAWIRLGMYTRSRIMPTVRRHQYLILILCWAGAMALAYIGFESSYQAIGQQKTPVEIVLQVLQMIRLLSVVTVSPSSWELIVARFLVSVLTLSTLALFVVAALYERVELLTLRLSRNHVVICGMGPLGILLARKFREEGYRVVGIEKSEKTREFEELKRAGISILQGDASNPDLLATAETGRARYFVSAVGDDGMNAEIAGHARSLVQENAGGPLTCFLHIVDPQLCNLLRAGELQSSDRTFHLEFFNIYAAAAHSLIRVHPPFLSDRNNPPHAHILVLGGGKMGETLIACSARAWKDSYGTASRLQVTLIDRNAGARREQVLLRYPAISHYCEIYPLDMDATSSAFLRGEFLADREGNNPITAAYVCFADDSLGLSAALALHQLLPKDRIPIVVRAAHDRGVATLLENLRNNDGEFRNLHIFPLIRSGFTTGFLLSTLQETIARAIHHHYLLLGEHAGFTVAASPSLVPWDSLPEHLKKSNREQADDILHKLDTIQCKIYHKPDWDEQLFTFASDEIEQLARMEHERWVRERKADGWVYGAERNDDAKAHPSLVPWDELSEPEREKDRNPIRTLPEVLATVDLKIIRALPAPAPVVRAEQ